MNIKKIVEAVGGFFKRNINGTKGAISLLLAFLMTPILSLALILVESSRYQSIVQLTQEISDMCSFSVLAEYDSYVEDRFGLLSVDQQKAVSDLFKTSLENNKGMLGSAVTLKPTSSASGAFALAEDKILFQQILEQSEIGVIAKTAVEGLDLKDLLNQLAKKAGWDKFQQLNKQGQLLKTVADIADAATDLFNSLKEYIKANTEFEQANTEYKQAYSKKDTETDTQVGFAPDMVALAEALKTASAALPEGSDADDVYDDDAVKDAVSNVKKSEKEYRDKAEKLKGKLDTLGSKLNSILDDVIKLGDLMIEYRSTDAEVEKDGSYDPALTDVIIATVTSLLDNVLKEEAINTAIAGFEAQEQDLQEQITKLKTLKNGDFKSVKGSWTKDKVDTEYGPIAVSDGFINSIRTAKSRLEVDVKTDNSLFEKLLELFGKLMDIQVFYDMSLNSVIDTSKLHQTSDPDLEDLVMITSIQTFFKAGETFSEAMEEDGLTAFIKYVEAAAEILLALAELLLSVIAWAGDFLAGVTTCVAQIATNPQGFYERVLLCGYSAYNMPNRLNCTTGTSLCGYSYRNVFLAHGGNITLYDGRTFGGSLSTQLSKKSGSDVGFKGAALEYTMIGSASEHENQFCVFVRLLLFRLILNLVPIFTSKEWGATPIYVKLIAALGESFIDTIFLVNGESEYLVKNSIYLSLDSIDDIIKKLSNIIAGGSIATLVGSQLKEDDNGSSGSSGGNTGGNTGGNSGGSDAGSGDGSAGGSTEDPKKDTDKGIQLFTCSYADHIYLMMVISFNKVKYLDRIQNLIQLEADNYYQKNEGYGFDLDKAYTNVHSTLQYQLNPIIKIDTMLNNGIFDVSISRYTGY